MRFVIKNEPHLTHLTTRDLCHRWHVVRGTIHNYIKKRWLNPVYLSPRAKRFSVAEVERFEAERRLYPSGGGDNE
jgi:hypothetical protein